MSFLILEYYVNRFCHLVSELSKEQKICVSWWKCLFTLLFKKSGENEFNVNMFFELWVQWSILAFSYSNDFYVLSIAYFTFSP